MDHSYFDYIKLLYVLRIMRVHGLEAISDGEPPRKQHEHKAVRPNWIRRFVTWGILRLANAMIGTGRRLRVKYTVRATDVPRHAA
jgi:hypothetical protein